MKLSDIIALLRNTIAVKTEYLARLRSDMQYYGSMATDRATAAFLDININELKKILADLEQVNEL